MNTINRYFINDCYTTAKHIIRFNSSDVKSSALRIYLFYYAQLYGIQSVKHFA